MCCVTVVFLGNVCLGKYLAASGAQFTEDALKKTLSKNMFQPRSLGFSHEERTAFDHYVLVRARVRFHTEGGYAVAWLDDLHSLHSSLGKRGDRPTTWMLPGAAPYATNNNSGRYIGGVKIVRMNRQFLVEFYGERGMIEGPSLYSVYAEVPFSNATAWDPDAWKILGSPRYCAIFQTLIKGVFPLIFDILLYAPEKLVAQDAEDRRVRVQWASAPQYPIVRDQS